MSIKAHKVLLAESNELLNRSQKTFSICVKILTTINEIHPDEEFEETRDCLELAQAEIKDHLRKCGYEITV